MSSDEVINQIIKAIVKDAADSYKNIQNDQISENNTHPLFNTQVLSQTKNYKITDTLAAFMIRAVALDPRHKFNIEKEMSRGEVDRLIKVSHSK